MDEQPTQGHEPTLKRPEESIEDLEPDAGTSEDIRGGEILGQNLSNQLKGQLEVR